MSAASISEAPSPSRSDHHLPEHPLVVIQPGGRGFGFSLREMWEYRELLYFLMWRDVKVRYKQTALGVLWVILQPLLMMLIFTVVFGRLAGIRPDDGVPYALFAFAGLLPWTFFSAAASQSGNSIINNVGLITKVYFPRLIVPIAAVGAVLLDLAISLCVLAGLMVYWQIFPGRNLFMLPFLVILITALALGFGILTTALNVKYRDVRIALPFIIQIWFFVSPIIYSTSTVTGRSRWILALNPMTGIVEGFRTALYGRGPFDWSLLALATVVTCLLLLAAVFTFKHSEKSFADLV